jgi:hypothetical protein
VRLLGYSASTPPATVRVNGQALRADIDYFASVDTSTRILWLTLNSTLSGAATLEVL